jgi:thiamine-phosphate pyrophosphorylase
MMPFSQCRLYAFVDTAYLRDRRPADVARQLCDGGADVVQLRAKSASPVEIRRMAETLLPILNSAGVGLVINDHLAVASETGALACHLGQEDFFDAGHTHVAQVLPSGSRLQIGLSTHAPPQAERALAAGPAYIAIGPVYPTPTKPAAPAVTLDYVRWTAAHVHIPWFAIGGITLENLDDVLSAGASRVCVVSAILNAPDPVKACQAFKDRLVSGRDEPGDAGSHRNHSL